MLQVIIMSGVSGAGKDTWIKKFQETNPDVKTFVVSADSYFTTKEGVISTCVLLASLPNLCIFPAEFRCVL